jgi:hypothetical protein
MNKKTVIISLIVIVLIYLAYMQYQKNQIAQTSNDGEEFMAMKKSNAVYENPNAQTVSNIVQAVAPVPGGSVFNYVNSPNGLLKIFFG